MMLGAVMYIATLKGELGEKMRSRSPHTAPLFTYTYGWCFFALGLALVSSMAAGTSAIFLFIYRQKREWLAKSRKGHHNNPLLSALPPPPRPALLLNHGLTSHNHITHHHHHHPHHHNPTTNHHSNTYNNHHHHHQHQHSQEVKLDEVERGGDHPPRITWGRRSLTDLHHNNNDDDDEGSRSITLPRSFSLRRVRCPTPSPERTGGGGSGRSGETWGSSTLPRASRPLSNINNNNNTIPVTHFNITPTHSTVSQHHATSTSHPSSTVLPSSTPRHSTITVPLPTISPRLSTSPHPSTTIPHPSTTSQHLSNTTSSHLFTSSRPSSGPPAWSQNGSGCPACCPCRSSRCCCCCCPPSQQPFPPRPNLTPIPRTHSAPPCACSRPTPPPPAPPPLTCRRCYTQSLRLGHSHPRQPTTPV
ncbi:hypothetical protein Pcinc_033541 [Petrolisthes cinctipes]|uniref:Uncharacterized protein n=1 Tax=Petrolisthes cinctipes TaxID=88211 RepID=A0AAE1JX73_PETCI|nr:hypothetical protein Pcinc_033541 [Petrolisthes cinctipes]